MNLKWLDSTASRVYAAIKTSFTSSTQPLIQLLVLNVAREHVVAAHHRDRGRVPQPGDPADRREQGRCCGPSPPTPSPPASPGSPTPACAPPPAAPSTSGHHLLGRINFGTAKTLRIMDADQYVHNATSTKQNIKAGDGRRRPGGRERDRAGTGTSTRLRAARRPRTRRRRTRRSRRARRRQPQPRRRASRSPPTRAGRRSSAAWTAAAFASCASPTSYSGLAAGSHTFGVRATDPAGNTDQSPATQTWTVEQHHSAADGHRHPRERAARRSTRTASSTVSVTKPAGTVAGNVLVSCLALNGGSVAGTGAPAGWRRIASVTTQANPKVFGYYKVATASEPAATRGPSRPRSPAAVASPATRGRAASTAQRPRLRGERRIRDGGRRHHDDRQRHARRVHGGELLLGDAHIAGRAEPGLGGGATGGSSWPTAGRPPPAAAARRRGPSARAASGPAGWSPCVRSPDLLLGHGPDDRPVSRRPSHPAGSGSWRCGCRAARRGRRPCRPR